MKCNFFRALALVVLVGSLSVPFTACSMTTAQLSEATMASSIDEITGQPIGTTDTFTADVPEIFASVKLSNAPDDTEVSSEWIYVSGEMEGIENYSIMTLSDNFSGTQYIYFSISEMEGGWPGGNYDVVLFIDGEEQLTIPFTVVAPAIPPKPEGLLTSDVEYQELWETFAGWGLDFNSLFMGYSQQAIAADATVMWLGDVDNDANGVYFKRVGNDWEPYDLSVIPDKPWNLLASDEEYQEMWVTFDSWGRDFYEVFTTTSQEGIANDWVIMWLGNAERETWVFFNRVDDSWEPYYMPPKPENLLASDAEYKELWETFAKWALDFNELFASESQRGVAEGEDYIWVGSSSDETRREYFARVGDDWQPLDGPPVEPYQEISGIMPARDYTRVTVTFTNTLEAGDVIEGSVEISGEYKTQDWSFDWTGEILNPEGDTIDIFRGHWVKETIYDINVEVLTAGEYTLRIRHNSKFEKELYINIRPEGWSY